MRPSLAKYKLYAPLTSVDGSPHCSYSPSPLSFPPTSTTTHLPQTIHVFPPEGFCLPVESPEIPLISSPFSPSSKLTRKRNENRLSAAKSRAKSKVKKKTVELKLKEEEDKNVALKDRLWALEAEIKCLQKLRYEMTVR